MKELVEEFKKEYPLLFRNIGNIDLCFGLSFGKGWIPLVRATCARLESHVLTQDRSVYLTDIKAKFGTLRIHLSGTATHEMRSIINEALESSKVICEFCGQVGRGRLISGISCTTCDPCFDKASKTHQALMEMWSEGSVCV